MQFAMSFRRAQIDCKLRGHISKLKLAVEFSSCVTYISLVTDRFASCVTYISLVADGFASCVTYISHFIVNPFCCPWGCMLFRKVICYLHVEYQLGLLVCICWHNDECCDTIKVCGNTDHKGRNKYTCKHNYLL